MKPTLHFQRFEFKYPLPAATAEKIIPALLKHMDWDPFVIESQDKYYTVSSLYFDTNKYACFWEKEAGVKFRKKLRLRVYDDKIEKDTLVFVEIKRKNDAVSIKDRIILTSGQVEEALMRNNIGKYLKERSEKEKRVLEEFFWTKNYNCMEPKLMVSYKRKPLIGKYNKGFRVTFDYDLEAYQAKSLDFKKNQIKKILPDKLILEVKYNNVLPYWFLEIIQKYNLERVAFSKYCNSLRTCFPELDDGSQKDFENYLGV